MVGNAPPGDTAVVGLLEVESVLRRVGRIEIVIPNPEIREVPDVIASCRFN